MSIRAILKILCVLATMVACGAVAFGAAVTFLMHLGLKLHDNYEYYRGPFGVAFIVGSTIVGFVAPAIIAWYLGKRSWQVSLRDLFIAMFIVAVLIGIYGTAM